MEQSATPSAPVSKFHKYLSATKSFLQRFPIFTRFLIIAPLVIFLLGLFTSVSASLINSPDKTIGSLQIHRLFTSPIAGYTFGALVLGLTLCIPTFSVMEHEWGTLKTMLNFFWKGLLINLIFIPFYYILFVFVEVLGQQGAYGPWLVFFAHLTEQCLQDHYGTPATIYWAGRTVNIKIYLAIVLVAFWFLTSGLTLSLIVAVLTGFLHFKFLGKFYNNLLSEERLARMESSVVFSWLKKIPNYAPAKGSGTTTIQPAANVAPHAGTGVAIGGDDKGGKNAYGQFDEENSEL